jgi:serine phosphatase RsbU (regulator of sigma subunit)
MAREQPERASYEHRLGVQDRLAAWVCDLSLLHELTERLARTALLDDTLREVVQAGGTLVGARRGLISLSPADGLGPDTTVGLGLGHADLGALETVAFASVPPGAEEVLHPDLRHGPGSLGRQREVAAQLGLGAGYGLALAVDRTVSAPDPANSSTSGPAASSGPGDTAALLSDPSDENLRDFSTGVADFSTADDGSPAPLAETAPYTEPAPFAEAAPFTEAAPYTEPKPRPAPAARRHRLGQVVWFYDEAAEPTARQRRLTGMYLRFAAEHIARGLDLARSRQAAADLAAEMLPTRLPRVPGVRMAVRHRGGPRGGGDWYDALPLPEGALGLAVGGVTGAGPGAVAARDRLRASLRAYAVMEGEDPVAVLSDLELLLRLTEPARSATALFGHVCAPQDAGGRRVTLAGAGHCPPLLVGDHRCEFVETSLSAPLNMLSCWEAPSVELRVRPGESLVLFTDGLLHRTGDCADRAFARVHAAARSATGAVREDPGRLADHLLHTVLPGGLDRTGGEEDLVLLVARFD